jgi:hypothetical protein
MSRRKERAFCEAASLFLLAPVAALAAPCYLILFRIEKPFEGFAADDSEEAG